MEPDLYEDANTPRDEMAFPSLPSRISTTEDHLTRSRTPSHGNPTLQSQDGPDKTASQIVQGADKPTRPKLSASGT